MTINVILAASLIVAPMPVDVDEVATPNAYPREMLGNDRSVYGEVELIVSPDGKIESCTLLSFVGSSKFSKRICGYFRRSHYKPALDTDGRPIYGRSRTSLRFFVLNTPEGKKVRNHSMEPDLIVELPKDTLKDGKSVDVNVAALVSEAGQVEACGDQPPPFNQDVDEALIEEACRSLMQKPRGPIDTESGQVQRYVTDQIVRFQNSEVDPSS